jgi:uncharacterized membrane protein YfbV (UPF0208 family)
MTSIAFGLACIGFIFLSISMRRHYHQVWPASKNFGHWYLRNRIVGYAAITLAALPCIAELGLWIGLVLWISILAAAAFLQSMLLTWWPQRSLLFGGASMMLIVMGLLL